MIRDNRALHLAEPSNNIPDLLGVGFQHVATILLHPSPVMDLPKSVGSGSPGDVDVLLRCCQIAPPHQRLEWDGRDSLVCVVTGSGCPETMGIYSTLNVCGFTDSVHSSVDRGS
jgi:hypothetical protein